MAKTMSFTNLARVIAVLALVLGVLRVLMGLSVATGLVIEPEPGRYLGSDSSGQAVDEGIYYIVVAALLGMVAEISRAVSRD